MRCKRCVYDDSIIPAVTFDEEGICNYCREHECLEIEYPTGQAGMEILDSIIEQMKKEGRGKKYDVVIGISGGCDSSYMLHLAKQKGLRVLAAHFDNTWNSRVAVENIEKMLSALDIDLYTHVVDHQEYDDIFHSFLLASVPDADIPTDLALAAVHYMAAEKYGIKYIWEGHSFRTEGIAPYGWSYMDAKYIQSVQKQFGKYKIKTLPMLKLYKWFMWMLFYGIKKIRPLYYIEYNKQEVKEMLHREYNWEWYGGHHMENRTAYFLNNYYQPQKFGIDLRYSEFSALIRSGQMEREKALQILQTPKPFNFDIITEIKKRLQISDQEFVRIVTSPNKDHRDYKTYKQLFERWKILFWLLYRMNLVPKSFYLKYTQKYDSNLKIGKGDEAVDEKESI